MTSHAGDAKNLRHSSQTSVDTTLASRGAIYGSYSEGSKFRALVMQEIDRRHHECYNKGMDPILKQMVWDIVNKLSRLAVAPDHIDTIHDIACYATLYEKYLREKENA